MVPKQKIMNQKHLKNSADTRFFSQALRKIMYLRRVKLDKLKELIRNPTRTPVRKAPDAPPPAAAMYTPPSFGQGAPYPTSGPAVPAPVNNWDQQTGSNANLPYPLNPTMAMPSPAYR